MHKLLGFICSTTNSQIWLYRYFWLNRPSLIWIMLFYRSLLIQTATDSGSLKFSDLLYYKYGTFWHKFWHKIMYTYTCTHPIYTLHKQISQQHLKQQYSTHTHTHKWKYTNLYHHGTHIYHSNSALLALIVLCNIYFVYSSTQKREEECITYMHPNKFQVPYIF